MSFGPEILSRFPNLRIFQIYSVHSLDQRPTHPEHLFDKTYSSIEEELRDLVIPWNRYCPTLREVQLTSGYKVIRGSEDGAWFVEKLECFQEREDFVY